MSLPLVASLDPAFHAGSLRLLLRPFDDEGGEEAASVLEVLACCDCMLRLIGTLRECVERSRSNVSFGLCFSLELFERKRRLLTGVEQLSSSLLCRLEMLLSLSDALESSALLLLLSPSPSSLAAGTVGLLALSLLSLS